MEQSESPPAVRVSPADPESRSRALHNSVSVDNDRRTPQTQHAGKAFLVVKGFFLLCSQRKQKNVFKKVRQHQQQRNMTEHTAEETCAGAACCQLTASSDPLRSQRLQSQLIPCHHIMIHLEIFDRKLVETYSSSSHLSETGAVTGC